MIQAFSTTKVISRLCKILMLLIGLTLSLNASTTPSASLKVLVLSHKLRVDPRLQSELAERNIHFIRREITAPISLEMLRQFHVVFLGDLATTGGFNSTLPGHVSRMMTLTENLKRLETYVDAGGGFLFTPDIGGSRAALRSTELMSRYGVKVNPLQVRDDAHAFVPSPAPKRNAGYSWTTQIADHPAAKGVKTIFYPTPQHRWDDFYSTPAVTLASPSWTALVRGMPSSTASWSSTYTDWTVIQQVPQVIAAVREFKRGRVGLLSVHSFYTLWHPYWEPKDHGKYGRGQIRERTTGDIDGIFMRKGDGKRKSQGCELLVGMLRWLGENAEKAGMGTHSPESFASLLPPEVNQAPEWLSDWSRAQGHKNYKVLVGARSEYSTGKGTLKEYARAAREAGLAILCMAEPMEHFKLSRWREYYLACQALSDESLLVVPGLDMQDRYGARYLLLNSSVAPQKHMLSANGNVLRRVEQLCINMPEAITIAHRVTSASAIPHQLTKHFQGISLYTYNGNHQLVDNSFPNYEWQLHRFSNPMPFVVHEVDDPAKVKAASQTGFQLFINAPTHKDLVWYFKRHGMAHGWESPLHMQVSSGPLLEEFGKELNFSITGENKLTEVRLMYNQALYRRWLPKGNAFTVKKVQLPRAQVNWGYLVATDEKGGKLISSGVHAGRQIVHTWRCLDRQNWWCFPNIYPGTTVNGFDFKASVPGSPEGAGGYLGFTQQKGPQRGDNLAPILDFSFASPEVYIQDVFVDQRYIRAVREEIVFDARPAHAVTRSRVFKAKVRYHQFFEAKAPSLPTIKAVDITLRRPVVVEDPLYPVITSLDMKNHRLRGKMDYAFIHPKTGTLVRGVLEQAFIDIPAGGRIGGLIVLAGTLRVCRDNRVGFPVTQERYSTLPIGTGWKASFISVPPGDAERWQTLIGCNGRPPYEISLDKGRLESIRLVAHMSANDHTVAGNVAQALAPSMMENLIASTSEERKTPPKPLTRYRLPLSVTGCNPNWPVMLWRPDGTAEETSVFEGKAWARLDITKPGAFVFGNAILADAPDLRMAILEWNEHTVSLEVNNPGNRDIKVNIRTNPAFSAFVQKTFSLSLSKGASTCLSYCSIDDQ